VSRMLVFFGRSSNFQRVPRSFGRIQPRPNAKSKAAPRHAATVSPETQAFRRDGGNADNGHTNKYTLVYTIVNRVA